MPEIQKDLDVLLAYTQKCATQSSVPTDLSDYTSNAILGTEGLRALLRSLGLRRFPGKFAEAVERAEGLKLVSLP